MARINSILAIVVQQGANELRVATDREPKMFAFGVPKRLSIPKTSEPELRALLGEVLSGERDAALRTGERLEFTYDAGSFGPFHVTLSAQPEGGFAAVFLRIDGRRGDRSAGAGRGPMPHPAPPPPATPALGAVAKGPAAETDAVSRPAPTVHAAPAVPSATGAHAVPAVPAPAEPLTEPFAREPAEERSSAAPDVLAAWVTRASELRASDLHLCDGEPPFVRIDGALRGLEASPVPDVAELLGLDPTQRDRLVRHRAVETAMDVPRIGRVRVHAYQVAAGVAAAVRLLPPDAPALDALQLPMPLHDLAMLPHGLVLMAGATGSGKSTTLAALAQEALRKRSILLVTLEDPIEYALAPSAASIVRRRQLGRDVIDLASGLRDALREDPDVLLVGEMRDPETIALALTAAETGHLVLASLHSRSASSAVDRIVDAYPPAQQAQVRGQLAESLRAVVAQRLLPRARGTGRIPVIEVLRVTHAVANLLREGKTAYLATAIQSSRREGMLALERCLADRVEAGEIRLDDARAAANDPGSLAMYLRADRPKAE